MKKYNSNTPLLSIHIPKCGGTSFKKVLTEWFKDNLYYHYFNEEENTMPNKIIIEKKSIFHRQNNHICIHGHFNKERGFGTHQYYPEIKQAITFLRDPLEIQLSVFYFNHQLSNQGKLFRNGEKFTITKDIDEYLESTKPYIRNFLPDELTEENIDDYFSNYFIHIGIMENYQHSLDILAEKLKKPKIIIPHENKSERFSTPSNISITKFKENCKFEYAFYNKVIIENN